MKALLEFLLWFLAILAVVLLPVLIEDWHVRHKHAANPQPDAALHQCNIALPKSPFLASPSKESVSMRTILDDLRAQEMAEYRRLCARKAELEKALQATADTDTRTRHDYRLTLLQYQSAIANFWL
jgi:hypothetical protein